MTTKANDAPAAAERKTYYAVRKFTDSGSERQFAKGKLPDDVEPGAIANYLAAGLVSTEKPKADAAA